MALPPTNYEFVRKVRPFVTELAEKDAADLLAQPEPPASIRSFDDYESRFQECLDLTNEQALEQMATMTGRTVEQCRISRPPSTNPTW